MPFDLRMLLAFPVRFVLFLALIVLAGGVYPSWYGQLAMATMLGLGLLVAYRTFLLDLLRYLAEHLVQAAILVLLLAMLYGMLGVSLGVPHVFWSEYWFARAFSALAVTLLMTVIGINAYYLDRDATTTRVKVERFLAVRHWEKFRLTRRLLQKFWLGRGLEWLLSQDIDRGQFENAHDIQQFLRLGRLPFLMLATLPALFPLLFPYVPRVAPVAGSQILELPDVGRSFWAWSIGLACWGGGILAGVVLVRLLLKMSTGVRDISASIHVPRRLAILGVVPAALLTALDASGAIPALTDSRIWVLALFLLDLVALLLVVGAVSYQTSRQHPQVWPKFFRFLLLVAYTLVVVWTWDRYFHGLALETGRDLYARLEVSPGMAVCILLAILSVLGAWFHLLSTRSRLAGARVEWGSVPPDPAERVRTALPLTLGVVLWIGLVNNSPYKLRFPNLDYSHPVQLDRMMARVYPELARPGVIDDAPKPPPLIDREAALRAWYDRACREQGTPHPKLVVVCSSGGASRAAYWTAVVLDRLSGEPGLRGFDQAVRMMTGASGGMVGASYYVRNLYDGGKSVDHEDPWLKDFETNPLPRLAGHIARVGIPLMLLPRVPGLNLDRGIVLEDQFTWRSTGRPALDLPIRNLREKEAAGEIPSLIFSPVIVDDGRRLLISNLDLASLSVNRGDELVEGDERTPPGSKADFISSLGSLEFFKFFHEQGAEKLTMGTAARMSASFPFVSPAVNLPSDPPLRLVDAGYYDNFGVNLAAIWVGENWEFLKKLGVSGIVLVQIRAFLGRAERMAPPQGDEPAFDLLRGFELIRSPIDAFGTGRFTGSVFRNDSELAATIEVVNEKAGSPDFLTTVIFENSSMVQVVSKSRKLIWPGMHDDADPGVIDPNTEVAMTWYVTEAEREAMNVAIPSDRLAGTTHMPGERAGPSFADSPRERLRWIGELVDKANREEQPDRRQATVKEIERALNYERIDALKAWWNRQGGH